MNDPILGELPCTPRIKQALAIAHRTARTNGQNYVGIEHLFLACLSYEEGAAHALLIAAGINAADLRDKVNAVYTKQMFAATDALPKDGSMAEAAALLRRVADILSA